jgi:putative transposase
MLTQTNHIRCSKEQYDLMRYLCRCSKNLYNVGLYTTRQWFFDNGEFLKYPKNYHLCKTNENYKVLQAATAQQTLKFVERNMRSFFGLLKLYKNGGVDRPSIPRYLDKDGYFLVAFPKNAFFIKDRVVRLGVSKTLGQTNPEAHKLLQFTLLENLVHYTDKIQEIHLIPCYNGRYFKIKYVYDRPNEPQEADPTKFLAIDLGLDNFATCVDSTGGTPQIICGRYIKSLNRQYNKANAHLQSIKDHQKNDKLTNRQARLIIARENRINEFMNRAVDHIVKHCLEHEIGNVCIGDLSGIKQKIDHGRKNNQNFVQIPYGKFKQKLMTKCEHYGINYHLVDEAYTSRTDALAGDEIRDQSYGTSRRVKRGLYQSSVGILINADVNGAINIMRKVAGDSVLQRILGSGRVNRPVRIRLAYEQTSHTLNC